MSEVKRYSTARDQRKIILVDSEGKEKLYTLRVFTGSIRNSYLAAMGEKMEVNSDGSLIKVKSYEGFQEDLIALCLYDEKNNLVPREEILNYPATTIEALSQDCLEINGMNKKGEKEIKKD